MNAFARPNVSLGLGSNFKWHDHWRLRATRIRSPQMCDRGRPETSDPHTEASSGRPTSAQRHSASEVPEPSGAPYVLKRQISRWRRIDRYGQSVAIFGPRLLSQRGADLCPTSAFERRLLIDNASRNVATSRCAWVADSATYPAAGQLLLDLGPIVSGCPEHTHNPIQFMDGASTCH
jgi:hypothetical protein